MTKVTVRRGDITIDATSEVIVNAANPMMLGGGGVDGSIHRAAGPELRAYCMDLPEVTPGVRCPVGEVVLTPAFDLPFKGIIHTVGPMFPGARQVVFPGEEVSSKPEEDLERCLRNVLQKVEDEGFRSVTIPLISCGVYGCPVSTFAQVARKVLWEKERDIDRIVIMPFEEVDFDLFRATATPLQQHYGHGTESE